VGKKIKPTASQEKEVPAAKVKQITDQRSNCDILFSFPEPPVPQNVVLVRFDPTSIGVSWNKFTLVELKGLANYIVTYTIIIDSRKRQSELGGTMTVPWTQNQVIISGLQSGAEYDVTVRTSTAAGMSGSCQHIKIVKECTAGLVTMSCVWPAGLPH
jgi:hypothetical protein